MFAKGWLSSSWLFGMVLMAMPALADDESDPERLFREARAAMLEGRFDEACPKLAESQRLDPHVGTLLNLAACHERQGKIASALVEYQQARTAAQAEGQAERARLAEQRIDVIEPRVPWLRVAVLGGSIGMTVTLDGTELPSSMLGKEMPVDPGTHVVVAERTGRPGFEERVELRERERRTVTVVAPPPSEEKAPPLPPRATTPPSQGRWIFEPGVYVAFVRGSGGDRSAPSPADAERITLERIGGTERTNCREEPGCSYQGGPAAETGSTGVNLFGGYALSDRVQLGFRLVVGAMFSGGVLVAFGPQASFRPIKALSIGVFAAVGTATFTTTRTLTPPAGFVAFGATVEEEERRTGAPGAGIELALRIVSLERGGIFVNTTPFFLGSVTEYVLGVPVGIAYRFQ